MSMGFPATGSAQVRPSDRPTINMSWNFSVHVFGGEIFEMFLDQFFWPNQAILSTFYFFINLYIWADGLNRKLVIPWNGPIVDVLVPRYDLSKFWCTPKWSIFWHLSWRMFVFFGILVLFHSCVYHESFLMENEHHTYCKWIHSSVNDFWKSIIKFNQIFHIMSTYCMCFLKFELSLDV